ncbi:MAG TPA: GNAT family N-acetyltransferase [bacterium]|nr:GNAT family N-acetyltransferase [bacterium]
MIKIRKAQSRDLKGLQKLSSVTFIKNPEYDDDFVENFMMTSEGEKYMKRAIDAKNGVLFIAEEEGEMIGYINGDEMKVPYRKSKYFELENLGVVPGTKRKGVGTKLLERITKWARKKGYNRIYLESYAKNEEALKFYRKKGFRDIDISLERKI